LVTIPPQVNVVKKDANASKFSIYKTESVDKIKIVDSLMVKLMHRNGWDQKLALLAEENGESYYNLIVSKFQVLRVSIA